MWFSHGRRALGRGRQGQIPEENSTPSAKKIPSFLWIQAGPREIIQTATNSLFSAKLLSFPSYFGDRRVPGGYFQPNMKAPFFQGKKNYLRFFFPRFLCTAQEMCRQLVPVPHLPYLHVFPGGDWLSFPLLHSILAPAQNHYKAWRTKIYKVILKGGWRSCCGLKVTLFSVLILLN